MTQKQYRTFMASMAEKFKEKSINSADGKNPEASTAYFRLAIRAAKESLPFRRA